MRSAALTRTPQHHVLDQRHVGERARDLERAGEAHGDAAMRGRGLRLRALNEDAARIRALPAGDQIEHRRLAGAVRSDQAGDLAPADAQGNAVHRDKTAEAFDEVLGRQDRRGRLGL